MPKRFLKKEHIHKSLRSVFWFSVGVVLGLFLFSSFLYIAFTKQYVNTVYPGVIVNGADFGGKTQEEVEMYYKNKNEQISRHTIVFKSGEEQATISAEKLEFGYNEELLAKQAVSIGRSDDFVTNASLVVQAYLNGIYLPATYHYSEETLETLLAPMRAKINVTPVEALFTFENGRVIAFQPSENGKELAMDDMKKALTDRTKEIVLTETPAIFTISVAPRVLKPKVSTEEANDLGITELIGQGSSTFRGSIPSRVYNISLAASRINGILVKPGEEFSFNKALGDVSAFTGYKQAYVIQNGRTVLGDGGGVCQVSTTFFRALLNAGLPITQRHAHAYRVGYYEQDSDPGFDATIYVPSVDLRFKNDTGHHILVQSKFDPVDLTLQFDFYGTKDGRLVTITKPVITKQTPPPPPAYQDDPELPKDQIKQVDFAAPGATVTFVRTVEKDGKTIISETFKSNYRAWQAVYLRGTKE